MRSDLNKQYLHWLPAPGTRSIILVRRNCSSGTKYSEPSSHRPWNHNKVSWNVFLKKTRIDSKISSKVFLEFRIKYDQKHQKTQKSTSPRNQIYSHNGPQATSWSKPSVTQHWRHQFTKVWNVSICHHNTFCFPCVDVHISVSQECSDLTKLGIIWASSVAASTTAQL